MAVKENATRAELKKEIERLQGEIATLEQNSQNQQRIIDKYRNEQEEQFLASPTYQQMQEDRKFLKAVADLTDINIVKDRKRLERDKQAVQQVYADNKAMMGQPEDYFIGITDCRHDTEAWTKLRIQVAEEQGAEEAYKILLSQRDEYILQLIQRLFAEPEERDGRKEHEELRSVVKSFGEQVHDKEVAVTVKLFDLYWLLREYDERKDKEDYIQKEIDRIRKEYDSLKLAYDKLRIATMPDITEEEIDNAEGHFVEYASWDRPKLVRNIQIANTKVQRRDAEIRELKRQLKEAESKRYDSYVGQDALSYSLLQEENRIQKDTIQTLNGIIDSYSATIDSLREQIATMQTATVDEKAELIGQTIEQEKETKKATRKKTGRKPTDDEKKALVIKLSEQNKSFREIAKGTGLSLATVSRIMNNYVLELYGKGKTEEQIIADTKLREKVVHKMIQEHFLSQIFLSLLDENQSDESAIEATRACQKEFESRNVGTYELKAFYDCARDYPVLETMEEFTVVTEAKKVY